MKSTDSLYEVAAVWNQKLQLYQKHLIHAYIDHWPNDVTSVLDVGCGDGKITQALAGNFKGTLFHGFDPSHEALSRLTIPKTQGSAIKLPFDEGQFDLVMSVDVLEHLEDQDEEIAWKELFRVAEKWVLATVPFMENLEEATAKCEHCNALYHVNWHKRSYNIDALIAKAAPGWSVSNIVLSGVEWSPQLPPEISFRRHNLNEWNGWICAECPQCHTQGKDPAAPKVLDLEVARSLGQEIYNKAQKKPYTRSHSEIIIAFSRDQQPLIRKGGALATKTSRACALIDFTTHHIFTNLEPFPQTARLVAATDGGFIAQFPAYPSSIKRNLFKVVRKNLDIKSDLIIEDGRGNVNYSTSYNGMLKPERLLEAGYYGILVRLPKNHEYELIELMNSPRRDFYEPEHTKTMSYYKLTETLTIQVPCLLTYHTYI